MSKDEINATKLLLEKLLDLYDSELDHMYPDLYRCSIDNVITTLEDLEENKFNNLDSNF